MLFRGESVDLFPRENVLDWVPDEKRDIQIGLWRLRDHTVPCFLWFWWARKHIFDDPRKKGNIETADWDFERQTTWEPRYSFLVERSNFLYFRMYLFGPLKRRERKRRKTLPPLHARWESREQKPSSGGTSILADRKVTWFIPRVRKHRWSWCWFKSGKEQTAWRFLVRVFGVKLESLAEEHKIGCLLMREARYHCAFCGARAGRRTHGSICYQFSASRNIYMPERLKTWRQALLLLGRERTTQVFIFELLESRKRLVILRIPTSASGISEANGIFRVSAPFWREETWTVTVPILDRADNILIALLNFSWVEGVAIWISKYSRMGSRQHAWVQLGFWVPRMSICWNLICVISR